MGVASEVINLSIEDKPADGVPRQHPGGVADDSVEAEVEIVDEVVDGIPGDGIDDVELTEALVEERAAELLERNGRPA